ncbi:GNAT family N-acetyltransferase [Roseivirga sp.]|uniref:GNAT family N-acetyltransferase n=1 Tax=Roseivirga sp. TaxID=1964215 RepID=UPI002B264C1B|nr:GNAT family N-acetyltransferase [Roseivirga sp.]
MINLWSLRLHLSLLSLTDLEEVHVLHSFPEVDEFNTLGIPQNVAHTQSIIKPWILEHQKLDAKQYTFTIRTNQAEDFVGLIALKLGSIKLQNGEVWFKLHPDFWGKGYCTEALKLVLAFGFDELKLHRIEAGCAVDNVGSARVLEKAGMTKEGRKRKVLPLKNGWSDNFEYAILDSDLRV